LDLARILEDVFADHLVHNILPLLFEDLPGYFIRDTATFAIIGVFPCRKDVVSHQEEHPILEMVLQQSVV